MMSLLIITCLPRLCCSSCCPYRIGMLVLKKVQPQQTKSQPIQIQMLLYPLIGSGGSMGPQRTILKDTKKKKKSFFPFSVACTNMYEKEWFGDVKRWQSGDHSCGVTAILGSTKLLRKNFWPQLHFRGIA